MSNELIQRLMDKVPMDQDYEITTADLMRFARLVADDCAKVCELLAAKDSADAIRRRFNEPNSAATQPPECCEGGPQWGHAWDCKKYPD